MSGDMDPGPGFAGTRTRPGAERRPGAPGGHAGGPCQDPWPASHGRVRLPGPDRSAGPESCLCLGRAPVRPKFFRPLIFGP